MCSPFLVCLSLLVVGVALEGFRNDSVALWPLGMVRECPEALGAGGLLDWTHACSVAPGRRRRQIPFRA